MNAKLALCVFLVLFLIDVSKADIFFNTPEINKTEADELKLKCVPGRTTMVVGGPPPAPSRSHMNFVDKNKDESCKICVCSTEGEDQYCSVRPAMTVNECLKMAVYTERFNTRKNNSNDSVINVRDNTLSQRLRRDLLWHRGEQPYANNSQCERGVSYYTNDPSANDTSLANITIAAVDSYLDFDNENDTDTDADYCYFCICHTSGRSIHCIQRESWICSYYKYLRNASASYEYYKMILGQERPSYFRSLSYRLRRSMDDGIYDLLEGGGDALCCEHSDGHRRNLLYVVKERIKQLRKKTPRENLLEGSPHADYADFIVNND